MRRTLSLFYDGAESTSEEVSASDAPWMHLNGGSTVKAGDTYATPPRGQCNSVKCVQGPELSYTRNQVLKKWADSILDKSTAPLGGAHERRQGGAANPVDAAAKIPSRRSRLRTEGGKCFKRNGACKILALEISIS